MLLTGTTPFIFLFFSRSLCCVVVRCCVPLLKFNVVKVYTEQTLKGDNFLVAKDFFRIKKDINDEKIYHDESINNDGNMLRD